MTGLLQLLNRLMPRWSWLLPMLAGVFMHAPVFAADVQEYRIKSAFLLNFTRFVEWPENQNVTAGPFRICIHGHNPFGDAIEHLQGKQKGEATLEIVYTTGPEQVASCQAIFMASESHDPALLTLLSGQPVLTVGEHAEFNDHGGMIQMDIVNNKVRFNINLKAARQAGLKVSSKLIRLATRVSGNQEQ